MFAFYKDNLTPTDASNPLVYIHSYIKYFSRSTPTFTVECNKKGCQEDGAVGNYVLMDGTCSVMSLPRCQPDTCTHGHTPSKSRESSDS